MRHIQDLGFLIFQLARLAGMVALMGVAAVSIAVLCWLGNALVMG